MENKFAYQMNAFAPTGEIKGRLDLDVNLNTFAGAVDSSNAEALVAGDPVSIVATTKKLPHYAKAVAGSTVFGFVKWNAKNVSYKANEIVEVASGGDVMYMEASAAISAGSAVAIDTASSKVSASDSNSIGYALESASADGDLIRVLIKTPAKIA